jgi:hypothetical protein
MAAAIPFLRAGEAVGTAGAAPSAWETDGCILSGPRKNKRQMGQDDEVSPYGAIFLLTGQQDSRTAWFAIFSSKSACAFTPV